MTEEELRDRIIAVAATHFPQEVAKLSVDDLSYALKFVKKHRNLFESIIGKTEHE